jgi:hypothetical protein
MRIVESSKKTKKGPRRLEAAQKVETSMLFLLVRYHLPSIPLFLTQFFSDEKRFSFNCKYRYRIFGFDLCR